MHQEEVTVLSVRKDGKGFKAALTGEGEQWLSIPPNLVGHIKWKESYPIGWTKTPRQDGGFFYNLKQLGLPRNENTPVSMVPAPPESARPLLKEFARSSPAEKDKQIGSLAIFKTVWPTYAAMTNNGIDGMSIAKCIRECMKAYDMSLGGQNIIPRDRPFNDSVDDIGDTF